MSETQAVILSMAIGILALHTFQITGSFEVFIVGYFVTILPMLCINRNHTK